jgi:hypothetical protein
MSQWMTYKKYYSNRPQIVAILYTLPILATSSAFILSRTGFALPIVCVLLACSVSPFVLFKLSPKMRGFGIYAISLTLILQNTMVHRNLASGDAVLEYYLAALTLEQGWDPNAQMAHNNLIRLVFGHPIATRILNFDLIWSFKLLHPFYVSILPVGVYILARNRFRDDIALGGACLYMFLNPFFVRLSRDTRSGTAIMLIPLFLFIILKITNSNQGNHQQYSIAAILLGTGIIGSHEGIAVLAMCLGLVIGASYLVTDKVYNPILIVIGLCSILYLWYTAFSGGSYFNTLTLVFYNFVAEILSGVGSSSASSAVSQNTRSFTYTFIRFEFIALYGAAGIGYLSLWYRRFESNSSPVGFLLLAGAGFAILAASFGPISIMGVQRTSAIVGVLVLPLTTYIILSELSLSSNYLCFGLAVILLINAGVIGWSIGERTPQPNLQRESISEEHGIEYWHLRSKWTTDGEIKASNWAYDFAPSDETIYATTGGGGIRTFKATRTKRYLKRQPGNYGAVPCYIDEGENLLYYNNYATNTGMMPVGDPTASYFEAKFSPSLMTTRSIIYSNADATIGLTKKSEHFC